MWTLGSHGWQSWVLPCALKCGFQTASQTFLANGTSWGPQQVLPKAGLYPGRLPECRPCWRPGEQPAWEPSLAGGSKWVRGQGPASATAGCWGFSRD